MSLLQKIKHKASALKADIYALYFSTSDPRTPWHAKLLVAIIVAYAISPIDLIPDFIPIIGFLDDIILLPLSIMLAIKLVPETVLIECRKKATQVISDKKPRSWFAAAIIILIWLFMASLIIVWFLNRYSG